VSVETDAPDRAAFFEALRARDLDRLRALAAADPSLVFQFDPKHCCGGTVMNVAVAFGDPGLLEVLMELGADPDQPSDWPPGPFRALHSIPKRHLDTLGPWLIERGAALDAWSAAWLGLPEALAALVEADPEVVRRKGPDGGRPLHFARTPQIVDFLLDRGAEPDAVCVDHGSTAAEWAAAQRPDVCRRLLDRGARGDEFMYAMIGDLDRLAAAIEADPGVLHARTTPDRFRPTESEAAHIYMYSIGSNATLMHAAASLGRAEVVEFLIARGLDPSLRGGYDDQTPAHGAAWSDHPHVIEALVRGGANVDLPSGSIHRNPPLGWAIVNGSLEAARALVGAGVELRDYYEADAEAGMRGEFRAWSAAPAGRFEAIRDLIAARRGVPQPGNETEDP